MTHRSIPNCLIPLTLLAALTGAAAKPAAEPLPQVHPNARKGVASVLMWHDVVAKKKDVWFDTTVAELESQFQLIKRRGLKPVTLEQLADHLEKGAPLPSGAVVLTFDDNDLGLYRYLYPMLQRYRWPAALFVHTDYVGRKTSKEHCTWDQLREMEKSGLVRVYPHTASHPADMREISEKQLQRELVSARQVLEKQVGGPRPFLTYSNGFYNERVARAAWKAGYRLAITEDWGFAQRSLNLMMVRRYSMHKRATQAIEDTARNMKK